MKLRKLFALVMTLVMLISMMPAAHAQMIWCPDLGVDHSWGPSEYWNGTCEWGMHYCTVCGAGDEVPPQHNWTTQITLQPGCDTTGYKEIICADCHSEQGNPEEIPALGHDWGSWGWAHGSAPSCTEGAWQVRNCNRCGQMEDKWVEAGSHQWGNWNTVTPGNCQTPAKEQRSCSVCGATENRDGSYGSHNWGNWSTVSSGTCNTPAKEQRSCSICGTTEQRDGSYGSHQWGNWGNVSSGNCETPAKDQRSCAVCGTTEQRDGSYGDHSWGEWYRAGVPTCTAEGLMRRNCNLCGKAETYALPKVDHVFGEWYVVAEAQVGLPGLEQRDCTYSCGTFEQREIPALEQDFDGAPEAPVALPGLSLSLTLDSTPANGTHFVVGEEVIFTETWSNDTDKTLYPFSVSIWTCDVPSYGSMVDQICSWFAEDGGGPVAPGASGSHTLTVTVTEADVDRGAIYAMAEILSTVHNGPDLENVTTPFVTAPCGESESLPTVVLEKQVMNAPANGEFFVPGEAIKFGFTLWVYGPGKTKASSEFIVKEAVIYDPLKEDQIVLADIEGTWNMGHAFLYTVTEEDAQRGYVENTGYATWVYVENGQPGRVDSNTVTTPCGFDNSGDFGLVNGLTVTKQVTSTPANGRYYEPGEDITFVITVSNQGVEPLLNVNVIDPLGGGLVTVLETLNVGETRDITVVFTTTDIVAWAGSVDNGACVKAVDKDGRQYVEYSNIVTVPCGHTFLDVTITPPFGIFHSLAVIKKEESLPLNGQYYTEGEVIHYSITYTNDGELPLTDVQIWDVLNVTTPVASAEMLNPGESRVCYYQHTVTAEDVAVGSVMNIAHASYPVPNAAGFANSTSNVVISKTSADDNVWIVLPIFPTPGEDPEYDPGTGWFPPDAGEETPDFGTIDTDALHGGETYCVRTITGRNNVSATYETTFCTEHADTQSSALIMAQAAATPELQMQSAAYAVALWRTEVESLYQEIFEAADPAVKTVVMTEYVRFLTDVANYEAMLKILYPDHPALMALKVAEIWENKCVDLCYDAHATAAERKDSLLAVTPTAGSSAVQCTCVTTSETNGQKTDVQSYCPVHSFPFSMIDALLQGNDTAESWTMVRRIWGVELTSAYNKIYEAMGDNKLLAMAEYNALTQWMIAREASLIALYPNNPEVVAQAMVKTIMDRVNDLCLTGK